MSLRLLAVALSEPSIDWTVNKASVNLVGVPIKVGLAVSQVLLSPTCTESETLFPCIPDAAVRMGLPSTALVAPTAVLLGLPATLAGVVEAAEL